MVHYLGRRARRPGRARFAGTPPGAGRPGRAAFAGRTLRPWGTRRAGRAGFPWLRLRRILRILGSIKLGEVRLGQERLRRCLGRRLVAADGGLLRVQQPAAAVGGNSRRRRAGRAGNSPRPRRAGGANGPGRAGRAGNVGQSGFSQSQLQGSDGGRAPTLAVVAPQVIVGQVEVQVARLKAGRAAGRRRSNFGAVAAPIPDRSRRGGCGRRGQSADRLIAGAEEQEAAHQHNEDSQDNGCGNGNPYVKHWSPVFHITIAPAGAMVECSAYCELNFCRRGPARFAPGASRGANSLCNLIARFITTPAG